MEAQRANQVAERALHCLYAAGLAYWFGWGLVLGGDLGLTVALSTAAWSVILTCASAVLAWKAWVAASADPKALLHREEWEQRRRWGRVAPYLRPVLDGVLVGFLAYMSAAITVPYIAGPLTLHEGRFAAAVGSTKSTWDPPPGLCREYVKINLPPFGDVSHCAVHALREPRSILEGEAEVGAPALVALKTNVLGQSVVRITRQP